jgi:transposase
VPETQFITPIAGVKVLDVLHGSSIKIRGIADCRRGTRCPRCSSERTRIKSTQLRKLKHGIWEDRLVVLQVKIPKLYCSGCRRYFTYRLPGVLPKKRSTEKFRQEIFHLHHGGLTQTRLEATHKVSASTVERWYHDFVSYRVKELEGRSCPLILGIDEHFFSRKDGYATTFADLRNHKVFDVVLGRSESSLEGYLKRLKGKDQVQIVVMDLSETYRSIIKKHFPKAMIVADRFHVVRLLNHQFLKVWGTLDESGRKNRGLLSLMRRHEWNLKEDQVPKVQNYFNQIPGLEPVYRFKQDLMKLLLIKHQRKDQVVSLIPQLLWHMNELLGSPFIPLKTFGQTLKSWLEPIVRMWRFTKSNGITEGLHTKMEVISRRAYGFRNFKNYRLRVIALCGWDGVFAIRRN